MNQAHARLSEVWKIMNDFWVSAFTRITKGVLLMIPL